MAFCLFAAVPVRFEVSAAGRLGFFESKSSLAALIWPEPRAPGFSACHTKSLKLPKGQFFYSRPDALALLFVLVAEVPGLR